MNCLVWDDRVARSAWQQMAIDRALADIALQGDCVIHRLYRWDHGSVSFGANEAACRTWDRERLERSRVPAVRRPTGGRGVWHDPTDLTYSVAAPLAAFGDLRRAYRTLHEQLARAFLTLGVEAVLAPVTRRPTLAPGACFDLAVGGEVLVGGRKVIGSAQALLGAAMLQHGAIALADRTAALARFRLDSPAVEPDIACTPLPPAGQLCSSIVSTWLAEGGVPAPDTVTRQALAVSEQFAAHFRDPGLTWRR